MTVRLSNENKKLQCKNTLEEFTNIIYQKKLEQEILFSYKIKNNTFEKFKTLFCLLTDFVSNLGILVIAKII